MKLSMWILADALSDYNPSVKMQEGKPVLQNARLLMDGSQMSRYTVYLSTMDEGRIALLNGRDIITVQYDDVFHLLDVVLDVFEHYNEWANYGYERIREGISLEELLEHFQKLTRFHYQVSDSTGFILGRCLNPELSSPDPLYDTTLKSNQLNLQLLLDMNQDSRTFRRNFPTYRVELPHIHCVSLKSNLFVNDRHAGWLIGLNPDNAYTLGQVQLQDRMQHMTECWLTENHRQQVLFGTSGMLQDILDGKLVEKEEIFTRLGSQGWHTGDPVQVWSLRCQDLSDLDAQMMLRSLQLRLPDALIFLWKGNCAAAVNLRLDNESHVKRKIMDFASDNHCYIGCGRVFTDIFTLKEQVSAAWIAAGYAKDSSPVCWNDVILRYCGELLAVHSEAPLLHPALDILREYDHAHDTELSETLNTFLQCSGSYKKTSDTLFIHRTTLMYRLDRITELTGIDLEDQSTRLHLSLSFLMNGK